MTDLSAPNQFVVDLAAAAESAGYLLVGLDLVGRQPKVRVQTRSGGAVIEISTEYGIGLDDLVGQLPKPEPAT